MRFSFQSGVRNDLLQEIADRVDQDYYPIDAKIRAFNLSFVISPHAFTTRTAYTVPAGRRAVLINSTMHIERVTLATVISSTVALLQITKPGSGSPFLAYAAQYVNVIGHSTDSVLQDRVWLEAGDKLEMRTQDSSTGGTIGFNLFFAVAEFNS